jgi:hypothetical protein
LSLPMAWTWHRGWIQAQLLTCLTWVLHDGTLDALPTAKNPCIHWAGSLWEHKVNLDMLKKWIISCPYWDFNSPVVSLLYYAILPHKVYCISQSILKHPCIQHTHAHAWTHLHRGKNMPVCNLFKCFRKKQFTDQIPTFLVFKTTFYAKFKAVLRKCLNTHFIYLLCM